MTIQDKLYKLKDVIDQYKHIDQYADWVLQAVNWYIYSGRASLDFERTLKNYPDEKLLYMVKKCLEGNMSTEGIIKTIKKELKIRESKIA